MQVNILEAKTNLSHLVRLVETGKDSSVTITGQGSYTGSKNVTFKIAKAAGNKNYKAFTKTVTVKIKIKIK